jgi:hypothetical protein
MFANRLSGLILGYQFWPSLVSRLPAWYGSLTRKVLNKPGRPGCISGNYSEPWTALVERATPNVLIREGVVSRESAKPRKAVMPVSLMLRSRRSPGSIIFTSARERIRSLGKFISWEAKSRLRTTLTRPGNAPGMGPACY